LVGDKQFKVNLTEVFFGKFYRLTNFKDPVSLVPLKCWRYRHVGEIVLFNEEGKKVDKSTLLVRFLLILIPFIAAIIALLKKSTDFFKNQLAGLIAPHSLVHYKENIQKNI